MPYGRLFLVFVAFRRYRLSDLVRLFKRYILIGPSGSFVELDSSTLVAIV